MYSTPKIIVNNLLIPPHDTVKYLGFNLDKTQNKHIKSKRIIHNVRSSILKTILTKIN